MKEFNQVKDEAGKQLKQCRDRYSDFDKYEPRVVEKAKELEQKYGARAVLDFGVDALYAQERLADARQKVEKQEVSTPPEKPGVTPAGTTKQNLSADAAENRGHAEQSAERRRHM